MTRDEQIQGTEWCLSICPYRDAENCRWFDSDADCYAENNRKNWSE